MAADVLAGHEGGSGGAGGREGAAPRGPAVEERAEAVGESISPPAVDMVFFCSVRSDIRERYRVYSFYIR